MTNYDKRQFSEADLLDVMRTEKLDDLNSLSDGKQSAFRQAAKYFAERPNLMPHQRLTIFTMLGLITVQVFLTACSSASADTFNPDEFDEECISIAADHLDFTVDPVTGEPIDPETGEPYACVVDADGFDQNGVYRGLPEDDQEDSPEEAPSGSGDDKPDKDDVDNFPPDRNQDDETQVSPEEDKPDEEETPEAPNSEDEPEVVVTEEGPFEWPNSIDLSLMEYEKQDDGTFVRVYNEVSVNINHESIIPGVEPGIIPLELSESTDALLIEQARSERAGVKMHQRILSVIIADISIDSTTGMPQLKLAIPDNNGGWLSISADFQAYLYMMNVDADFNQVDLEGNLITNEFNVFDPKVRIQPGKIISTSGRDYQVGDNILLTVNVGDGDKSNDDISQHPTATTQGFCNGFDTIKAIEFAQDGGVCTMERDNGELGALYVKIYGVISQKLGLGK